MNLKDFGMYIGNSWGVGKKETDNGLVITIAKNKRELAITTGYGTKKTISDLECKIIIDSIIEPQFQKRNYFKAINKAIDSIIILWD